MEDFLDGLTDQDEGKRVTELLEAIQDIAGGEIGKMNARSLSTRINKREDWTVQRRRWGGDTRKVARIVRSSQNDPGPGDPETPCSRAHDAAVKRVSGGKKSSGRQTHRVQDPSSTGERKPKKETLPPGNDFAARNGESPSVIQVDEFAFDVDELPAVVDSQAAEPFRLVAQVPPPPCTCKYEQFMKRSRREKEKINREVFRNMSRIEARFCDRHRSLSDLS